MSSKPKQTLKADKPQPKDSNILKNKEEEREGAPKGLHLMGHFTRDLSFECPQFPHPELQNGQNPLEMQLNIQSGRLAEDVYALDLFIRATGKLANASQPLFVAELVYTGLFQHVGGTEDEVRQVLSTRGAALLYPFARHLLMTLIQSANVRPPLLEAIDFDALYASNKATAVS